MTHLKYPKKETINEGSWISTWTPHYLEEVTSNFAHLIGVRVSDKAFSSRKRCIYDDLENWYEATREKQIIENYIQELSGEKIKPLRARIFRSRPRSRPHNQFLVRGFLATVPSEMAFLEEVIQESSYILDLQEGWDGDNAAAFKYETWTKAAGFLVEYYKYIFLNTGKVLPAPEFLHSSKGSIDLLWRRDGTQLLINVPEADQPITFFGFNLDDESVKGKFKYPSAKFSMALAIANLF